MGKRWSYELASLVMLRGFVDSQGGEGGNSNRPRRGRLEQLSVTSRVLILFFATYQYMWNKYRYLSPIR